MARSNPVECTLSRLGQGLDLLGQARRGTHLIDRVLPEMALRRWVLTFPFAWRNRLARDGALLSALTRRFVATVESFYQQRAAARGAYAGKTGAITVVQRTSSDLRLNPHLHVVLLDGTYHEQESELAWRELGRLASEEVGAVLERAVRKLEKYVRTRGLELPRQGGQV